MAASRKADRAHRADVVCVAISLYLIYLLRKPISWLLIATFLAVALSAPVNVLARHMRRGFAIAIVYLGCWRCRSR